MSKHKRIIVVLPAYNAEKTLKRTVEEIPQNAYDEIILVDDASSDYTINVAKRMKLNVIKHEKNKGYGGNQKTCYDNALRLGADIVVMLHPDYQYDPKILPSLTAPLIYDYADIVLASRMLGDPHKGGALQGGMPVYKYISNRFLTTFQNIIFRMHLSEYHTGYRAYSRKFLQTINYKSFSDDFIFDNELLIAGIRNRMRFMEVPVKTRYFKEASSINLLSSIKYGIAVINKTLNYKPKRKL